MGFTFKKYTGSRTISLFPKERGLLRNCLCYFSLLQVVMLALPYELPQYFPKWPKALALLVKGGTEP